MSYNLQKIKEKVEELNLPFGQYILVGGASLVAHGIRETKDLDIIVLPDLFEKLIEGGWETDEVYRGKWNRRRVIRGDIEIYPDLYFEKSDTFLDIEKFIQNAKIIEGIPFQPLEHLMMCKLDSGREKDLIDIKLIEEYLIKSPTSNIL